MITAYTDGACRGGNPGYTSCAFVVYDGDVEIDHDKFYLGLQTNNYAEYMGVLKFLEKAEEQNVKGIAIYCDSKLVVNQVNGEWRCLEEGLKPLMYKAFAMLTRGRHRLVHVGGHSGLLGNDRADALCNMVLDKEGICRK